MTKTQVYLPEEDLRALHRIARERGRPVAELIREAIRSVDSAVASGPVALWGGRWDIREVKTRFSPATGAPSDGSIDFLKESFDAKVDSFSSECSPSFLFGWLPTVGQAR